VGHKRKLASYHVIFMAGTRDQLFSVAHRRSRRIPRYALRLSTGGASIIESHNARSTIYARYGSSGQGFHTQRKCKASSACSCRVGWSVVYAQTALTPVLCYVRFFPQIGDFGTSRWSQHTNSTLERTRGTHEVCASAKICLPRNTNPAGGVRLFPAATRRAI